MVDIYGFKGIFINGLICDNLRVKKVKRKLLKKKWMVKKEKYVKVKNKKKIICFLIKGRR